ncbi:sodium/hydrogen exchanger 9B2-like [Aplochiton taeniatus]
MTMVESSSSCCSCFSRLRQRCLKPHGLTAHIITKGCMLGLLFAVVWSITPKQCLPGENLFGIIILFITAVLGGKLVGMIQLPSLPPFPPLLGMLLAGLALRNVPYVTEAVYIDPKWSGVLRQIGSTLLLIRVSLGLNPKGLRRLKAVCLRVAVTPCVIEASTVAVVSHFLLGLPWIWGFMLGFVVTAQSPAVVGPSLLLRAGSYFTVGLAFLTALGWGKDKAPVLGFMARAWDVFQPLLFGLNGANITIATLSPSTVGLGLACIAIGLVVRLLVTYLVVHCAGFNLKEKLFISVAWLPKATVQAALGYKALDLVRGNGDPVLIGYGLQVLTLAVLVILITSPIGLLGIGLTGPRLLHRHTQDKPEGGAASQESNGIGQLTDSIIVETKL